VPPFNRAYHIRSVKGRKKEKGAEFPFSGRTPFVHPVIDTLEIERCEVSECVLPKRRPNVSVEQRLVITGRFRSELWPDCELELAVEVLVEGQTSPLEFPAPVALLEPVVQVVLRRSKSATDGAIQVLPQAGLPVSPQGYAYQPASLAPRDDLSAFSDQSALSCRVRGRNLAHISHTDGSKNAMNAGLSPNCD